METHDRVFGGIDRNVPLGVIQSILEQVDPFDILCCRTICKDWLRVIKYVRRPWYLWLRMYGPRFYKMEPGEHCDHFKCSDNCTDFLHVLVEPVIVEDISYFDQVIGYTLPERVTRRNKILNDLGHLYAELERSLEDCREELEIVALQSVEAEQELSSFLEQKTVSPLVLQAIEEDYNE